GQAGAEGPVSLIQATREGWAFADRLGWDDRAGRDAPLSLEQKRERFAALRQSACQCGPCLRYELGLAGLGLAAGGQGPAADRLPEELIGQAIKMVTMHEVGHTLGLRHNFKASTMLPNDKLHDTSVTRAKGLVGSVMDYTPVN